MTLAHDALRLEAEALRVELVDGRVTAGPSMLETANRMAPGEAFAREAYALLEQETIAAYEGAGERISPEARRNLEELHALIGAGAHRGTGLRRGMAGSVRPAPLRRPDVRPARSNLWATVPAPLAARRANGLLGSGDSP